MSEVFLTKSAVMLFLFKENGTEQEILLQKRFNTGYLDGMWDCSASGHVEENESMKMALLREAKEEINIDIELRNIHFATIMHKYTPTSGNIYYNGYFFVNQYEGNPIINEPQKCSDLCWFSLQKLPDDFIPDRLQALNNYLANIPYDEIGWDSFRIR